MGPLRNRRLVISHNPHSSRASEVQEQVFDRLDAAGYAYETIEVRQAHLNDNVARLAPLIKPGDIILSAAGDGSAHATAHAVMAANQPDVELGFLAYGNFNDLPNTFNTKATLRDPVAFLEAAKSQAVWPIDVYVNDEKQRSALLYATIGWTASAAGLFDAPHVRRSITHGGAGIVRSLCRTGLYYLRSRRGSQLPAFLYNDKQYVATDLLFANGPTLARLFKTGVRYYSQSSFLFRTLDVRKLVPNIPFLMSGLLGRITGEEVSAVLVTFPDPSRLQTQCDGEVFFVEHATKVEVRKSEQPLMVLGVRPLT
jgi:hypothetical protein